MRKSCVTLTGFFVFLLASLICGFGGLSRLQTPKPQDNVQNAGLSLGEGSHTNTELTRTASVERISVSGPNRDILYTFPDKSQVVSGAIDISRNVK